MYPWLACGFYFCYPHMNKNYRRGAGEKCRLAVLDRGFLILFLRELASGLAG